ncbi:hypothetical protein PG993_011500 [Apiospora rasikravindrae]|uniref:Aminoglycoside phosphotransferase domain-containing protein n=1 Tax=Apiospora rasikravindrae TaxID=990691 RepID=A0ABR1SG65_9PEZI
MPFSCVDGCLFVIFSPHLTFSPFLSLPIFIFLNLIELMLYCGPSPPIPDLLQSVRLPESYFARVDASSGQGVVFLEDLAPSSCTFSKPERPMSADQVWASIEQLSHMATWVQGDSLRDIIPVPSKPGLNAVAPRDLGRPDGDRIKEHEALILDRERLRGAFEPLWSHGSSSSSRAVFQCIVHGEPHIINTFVMAAGVPGFLDWEILARENGLHDLTYFVASALTVEDRRPHDESMVKVYKEAL